MKGFLLDVNALISLFWASHEHHGATQRWFAAASAKGWATCSLTQIGFVRIVCNPTFSKDAVRPAQALAVLEANLQHPRHQGWEDSWGAADLMRPFVDRLVGHRQITDAYLLGLALRQEGRLATLDSGIEALAPSGGSFGDLVERIPLSRE